MTSENVLRKFTLYLLTYLLQKDETSL